jgi:phospholipid-binding lipoprotein MlaA
MDSRHKALRLLALASVSLSLFGCATVPRAQRDPRDPWQSMNRATFKFDMGFEKHFAAPVATGYDKTVPHVMRQGISNFFANLSYPAVIVNDLLQGQFKWFLKDTGRLVVNSTLGLGGLLDPASQIGLPPDNRDFGQTFGKWGIPPGPYLVLPILGPSDVRDAVGRAVDVFASPTYYTPNSLIWYTPDAVDAINNDARLQPTLHLVMRAYNPYTFMRHAYLSQRHYMVHGPSGGNPAAEELKELQGAGK